MAYYPFNGNAKDESGNGNHGEVKGAALSEDRHGEGGKAYALDGANDYISVPHRDLLNIPVGLSLSLWVKADKLPFRIMTKGNGDQENYDYSIGASPDGRIGYGWRTVPSGHIAARTIKGITAGDWHHLVVVHTSGSTPIMYMNGVVQSVTPEGGQASVRVIFKQPIHIGVDPRTKRFQNYSKGSVDDLRIYSRALSTDEVAALYDLEKPTTPKKEAEHTETSIKPYKFDRNTVLLEHFEDATTGKSNRPISFDEGRIGKGVRLTPETYLSWNKGPLAEGTFEFWFKPDHADFLGDLASANYVGLPAAITILMQSRKKPGLYSEIFTQDWQRPKYIENHVKPKKWNHVAVSWGRKGVQTHLNGIRIGNLSGSHLLNRLTGTWVIGAQIRSGGRGGFSGVIDELRISRIQREFKPTDF